MIKAWGYMWICKHCKKMNKGERKRCWNCNVLRD